MGWIVVFFDLPVKEKEERYHATRFRNDLLKDGYTMIQYSVYARPCPSFGRIQTHIRRLKNLIPPYGEVRSIYLTDAQWGKMEIFSRRQRQKPEDPPEQILLF